jgi:hypothetical protein
MDLSRTSANVDACVALVNADVFMSFAQQSFRFTMTAMDAFRQKARQNIFFALLGCALLARECDADATAKGSARHVALRSGLSAALGINLQQV